MKLEDFKKRSRFKLRPGAMICLSFLIVILLGSAILMLPISVKEGVKLNYIDSLFTTVSAVCVTGLASVDIYDTFTIFGQAIVAILIQLGGLGVTSLSVGVILIYSGGLSTAQSKLIKEAWNIDTLKGLKSIFYKVLLYNVICETIGACLSLIVFSQDFSFGRALGTSIFHSIASFNNSGFDIIGGFRNLTPYSEDILLNLTTTSLIILGGIGFLVVIDVVKKRFNIKKLALNSKIILSVTAVLLLGGMVAIKLSEMENITWLGAWFFSVSCRTAGFSTFDIYLMRESTKSIMILLQFIGAAPGSTGGGIKVTTFFILLVSVRSCISSHRTHAFKRDISEDTQKKSFLIMFMAAVLVIVSALIISAIEQNPVITVNGVNRTYGILDYIFETVSAFATVGLSTGFTPYFTVWSKIILILCMYIGRLGPMTIVTLWSKRNELSTARFVEENVSIG